MAEVNPEWHVLKKSLFRFFFVFFPLQILTQDFTGNWWLGKILSVWKLGEKFFTPPFLWLNDHVFHLYYHPPNWTTFSPSLNLIRHITYTAVALVACLVWTIVDKKRTDYIKLNFWFSKVLCICLSCTVMVYGLIKVIPLQMYKPTIAELQTPIGDLSPFNLLWITFGYGQPYQIFTGLGEVLGASLILFRRTRPLGLLILSVILSNVVVINYTYVVGVAGLSFLLLMITGYLFMPYLKNFGLFLFTDQLINQSIGVPNYTFNTKWKKNSVTALGALIVATNFLFTFNTARLAFASSASTERTRKYSIVKNFVANGDTLNNLILKDNFRWRFWSERISRDQLMVTLFVMDLSASKNYALTRDSINQTLTLKPLNKKDTVPLQFTYKETDKINWHLEGTVDGQQIVADLQKVSPDSTFKLLRIKRHIFETDQADYGY
jgi:hypothetical protein